MSPVPGKAIEVGGMKVQWEAVGDHWEFSLEAPTSGWLAIGFNHKNDIVGANLIMAAVINDRLIIEDQYVTGLGKHPEVSKLGAQPVAFAVSSKEKNGTTQIVIRIPQKKMDRFHYDLIKGQSIWLICAYSQDDSFDHHSRMRKHLQITL